MECAALRRALPRTKGGPSGLGFSGRLGNLQAAEPGAWGGRGSHRIQARSWFCKVGSFPQAERGRSFLRLGCARAGWNLGPSWKAPTDPERGECPLGFCFCFSVGARFRAHLKFPAFLSPAFSGVASGRERVRGRVNPVHALPLSLWTLSLSALDTILEGSSETDRL